jgi:hypothetical protein
MAEDAAPGAGWRIVELANTFEAFGMVIDFLSASLPFSSFELGPFSGVIRDQLSLAHNFTAIDPNNNIVGYAGWILTTRANAELWERDMGMLRAIVEPAADAAALTVVASNNKAATLALIRACRDRNKDIRVFFKRGYDGQMRTSRKSSVLNFGS